MAVRTFVALELSREVKEGILGLVEALKLRGIRASWARASTLHLTLKFLGDVPEGCLDGVTEAVGRAARATAPFEFVASGLGAFPSTKRPRVVWVGIQPSDELFDLAERVEGELARAGFPKEKRGFRPHVTVGRIRDSRTAFGLAEALEAQTFPEGRVVVGEIRVMKSTLAPGGAIHEVTAALPLEGGRGERE